MKLDALTAKLKKRDAIPKGWKTCTQWSEEWGVTVGYGALKLREAERARLVERRLLRGEKDIRPVWYHHFKSDKP